MFACYMLTSLPTMVRMNLSYPQHPVRRRKAQWKVSVIGILMFLVDLAQISFNLCATSHEALVYSMTRKLTAINSTTATTTTTTTTNDAVPRILLSTFVFSEKAVHKKSLRMFVESARHSGVDLAIVGYPAVPFVEELPPNVKYFKITWGDLVTRVQQAVLDNKDLSQIRTTDRNKIFDEWKPLFGHLFPELITGYSWWGHVDNKLVLGNLRAFLTPTLLQDHDLLCAMDDCTTSGPLTLYRNSAAVNELLFNTSASQLLNVFKRHGEAGDRQDNSHENQSTPMEETVEQHADIFDLRWRGTAIPLGYVEACKSNNGLKILDVGNSTDKNGCTECHLVRLPNGLQRLTTVTPNNYCQHDNGCEVGLCNLNKVQHATLKSSLSDPTTTNLMIQQGQFRVTFEQGFQASSQKSKQAQAA